MKRFGVLSKIGRGSCSVLFWNINKGRYRPTHVSVTGDNIFKNRITGAIIVAVVLLIAKLPDALCVIIIFYENFKSQLIRAKNLRNHLNNVVAERRAERRAEQ